MSDAPNDFYEDDEPVEDIYAAMFRGIAGLTSPHVTTTFTSATTCVETFFPRSPDSPKES